MTTIYKVTTVLTDTCALSQRLYAGLSYDKLIPIDDLEENKFNHQLYKNYANKKHGVK